MDIGLIHTVKWKVEIQPELFRASEIHFDKFDRALQDNEVFCDFSLSVPVMVFKR